MGLVFVDSETTGLDSDRCDIWELAIIQRTPDGDREYCWQFSPNMLTAEPTGLRIGRFYERNLIHGPYSDSDEALALVHPDIPTEVYPGDSERIRSMTGIARAVAGMLDGATLVGAVPDFDARFLSRWLRNRNQAGTWHYHLVDVETLAAGALRIPPPWRFDDLLARVGLVYDEAERHTALGDARMVRDLYDQVMSPPPDGGDR